MTTKRQSAKRLRYLHDVVIPHLESMPTAEDFDKAAEALPARVLKKIFAVFDLNAYININNTSAPPINEQYDCGRRGCLAGWYVMMAEKDGKLDEHEQRRLRSWDTDQLGDHFGVTAHQAQRLFGSLGSGVEELRPGANKLTNTYALRRRKARIHQIIKAVEKSIAPPVSK